MKITPTLVVTLVLVALCAGPSAFAQTDFHVFPQVADGAFADGTFYRTTVTITPRYSDATCTLVFQGLSVNFGAGEGSVFMTNLINEDGFLSSRTTGVGAFQSGYATVTCDTSVFAEATYSFYAANGSKLSEATVFGSSESYSRRIMVDGRDNARLGVAIANNTEIARTYEISLLSSSGATLVESTVEVGRRSALARFVDELDWTLPSDETLMLQIRSNDFSSFSAVGLRFTGAVFTTVPAN